MAYVRQLKFDCLNFHSGINIHRISGLQPKSNRNSDSIPAFFLLFIDQ